VIGTLTLPATFFCAREIFLVWDRDRQWATWAALASTFILSITYLHLHYSRIGLRTITLPLFLALGVGLLVRGIRRDSWPLLALSGLAFGLSIYTYIASRLAPVLLAVPPVALVPSNKIGWALRRVAAVAAVWILVSLPLGIYTVRHAAEVQSHTDDVSILNPANNHGDPAGAIVHGVLSTIGSIDFVGSAGAEQNLPFRPLLDPLESVFFGTGLVILAVGACREVASIRSNRLSRESMPTSPAATSRLLIAGLVVGWILDQALPSALSVNPPGFIRMTGLLPPVAIAVGLGLGSTYRWLRSRSISPVYVGSFVGVCLAISSALTIRDYFLVWGPSPEAYHLMMADKVDSAKYLDGLATRDRVFLAPLWATDNTVRFFINGSGIQSFDLGQGLVVPTDRSRDVHYVFPASDDREAPSLARELNVPVSISTVRDDTGRYSLLTRLDLKAADLPSPPPTIATFEQNIGLVGALLDASTATGGSPISFRLEWVGFHVNSEDFTVFVHLRNATNQTITQADGQPVGGSFPTSQWRTGDIVWDRRSLTVPASTPAGRYHLVVGLYRRETLVRLPAQTRAGRAESDEVVVGEVSVSGS